MTRLAAFSPRRPDRDTSVTAPAIRARMFTVTVRRSEPGGFPDRASDAYEGVVTADGTLVTRFVPNVGDREHSRHPILTPTTSRRPARHRSRPVRRRRDHVSGACAALRRLGRHHGAAARRRAPTRSRSSDPGRGDRCADDPGGPRARQLVGGPSRDQADQEDDRDGHADRRRRPRRAGPRDGRRHRGRRSSPWPSTRCSVTSRVRSTSGRPRRTGCAGSSPTRRTSCARRSPRSAATPSCTASVGSTDADALDDAMRRTEQEATRMGRLVEDMLVLARLDEHRPLAIAPVDLAALVADAGARRPGDLAGADDQRCTVPIDRRWSPATRTGCGR